MGETVSKEIIKDERYQTIKKIIEQKGPDAVKAYIQKECNRWKDENVSFAVTGRSATGKSTFINKVRNVKPGDKGFAKTGSGNTTKNPTPYENPQNKKIVFYDLPGVGTLEFPKETYDSRMKLCQYDYFFIFFDKVVSEDDYFLISKLVELKKPFSLVRSKIDEDVRNAADDGKIEEDIIPEIRQKINEEMSSYSLLNNSDVVFLISSKHTEVGDWCNLLSHIEKCLETAKYDAFIVSLPNLIEDVIEKKYDNLKNRVKYASLMAAGAGAIPIPGVSACANVSILVEEVFHYITTFELSEKIIGGLVGFDVKVLKCSAYLVGRTLLTSAIYKQLGKMTAVLAAQSVLKFIPFLGPIIASATSAALTYSFLDSILDDFRDDAKTVYHFATKNISA